MVSKKNNKFNLSLALIFIIISIGFVSSTYSVCVEQTCPGGDQSKCYCSNTKCYDEHYKEILCADKPEIINQPQFNIETTDKDNWIQKADDKDEDNWKKYNEYMNKSEEFKFEKKSTKFQLGDNITDYNCIIKIEELEARIAQLEAELNNLKNENIIIKTFDLPSKNSENEELKNNSQKENLFSKLWNKIRF